MRISVYKRNFFIFQFWVFPQHVSSLISRIPDYLMKPNLYARATPVLNSVVQPDLGTRLFHILNAIESL